MGVEHYDSVLELCELVVFGVPVGRLLIVDFCRPH